MNARRAMFVEILLGALLFAAAAFGVSKAAAQAGGAPDLAQFGYSRVIGTVNFTPGQAATLTAGNQQVILPSDFISKTVKFELLEGDNSTFQPLLDADDQNREILAAFAFRVTDASSGALIGRFDKPVTWSVTSSTAQEGTEIYNTSAANPPAVTLNPTLPTISGQTVTHTFGGAGVGWLALNAEGTLAPGGLPKTGQTTTQAHLLTLAVIITFSLLIVGFMLRRTAQRS